MFVMLFPWILLLVVSVQLDGTLKDKWQKYKRLHFTVAIQAILPISAL